MTQDPGIVSMNPSPLNQTELDIQLAALGPMSEELPAVEYSSLRFAREDLGDTPLSGVSSSDDRSYRPDGLRVFYHSRGHFHGDYSAVDIDFKYQVVTVLWDGGLTVELTGQDAYRFLKLNRSKHALAFAPRRSPRATH